MADKYPMMVDGVEVTEEEGGILVFALNGMKFAWQDTKGHNLFRWSDSRGWEVHGRTESLHDAITYAWGWVTCFLTLEE